MTEASLSEIPPLWLYQACPIPYPQRVFILLDNCSIRLKLHGESFGSPFSNENYGNFIMSASSGTRDQLQIIIADALRPTGMSTVVCVTNTDRFDGLI